MPKVKSKIERIGSRFEGFEKNGSGYMASCPAHDDNTPSLSINEGDNGRIVLHCHAGCDTKEILQSVGLSFSDLNGKPRIVAEYDYRDEKGQFLYQSVRYEPKEFRQRKPDGQGDWIWKGVPDDKKVLYGLRRVRTAKPSLTVFVVEGEKDADRLNKAGLVATTNVGGASSSWLPQYSEALKGKSVAILPDNDEAGWDRAEKIVSELQGVAASVKIVELPNLPEHGDVSDWLDSGGTKKQLLTLTRRTPNGTTRQRDNATKALGGDPTVTQRNGEPLSRCPVVPLGGPVEPYPVEILPGILRRRIESIAAALPCPPDFPGTMMLPVLATFIGRRRRIQIKPGWEEYPLLWVGAIARSGDRKTPAFEKVIEPLRCKQQELFGAHLEAKSEYDALDPKEQREIPRPRLRQIVTTDTTIEALKEVLSGNPNGICFPADELGAWTNSIGQYKGGRGDDRQHWLSIWSGRQVVSNRAGREPIIIPDPFVCVTGGIQPDALGDLIDTQREDGFSARILFSYPDPIPQADWTDDSVKGDAQYNSVCERLWDLEPNRHPITFDDVAKRLWVEWVNAHRKEIIPDNLRPAWSKAEGHCARLCLVLFLSRVACNETTSSQADQPSMRGAIAIIEYFKSHARRVYATVTDQADTGRIGNAIRWLKKQGGTSTARKANMYGLCKTSDDAKQLFQDLEKLGYGKVTKKPRGSIEFSLNANATTNQRDNV